MTSPEFTAADLDALGRSIFGERWQSALARALGMSAENGARQVRRWASGESSPGEDIRGRILDLAADSMAAAIGRILAQARGLGIAGPPEIALAVYRDTAELRDLTGDDWSAEVHRALIGRVAERLAGLGLTVRVGLVDRADYRAWLGGRANASETRAEYAALSAPGPWRLGMKIGPDALGWVVLGLGGSRKKIGGGEEPTSQG
jgi:hypothetical protein